MTGNKAGFKKLFTKEGGHTLIGFHYIMHEEVLCAKADLKALLKVMQIVTKVLNCSSVQALHKRQFLVLLMEVVSVHK